MPEMQGCCHDQLFTIGDSPSSRARDFGDPSVRMETAQHPADFCAVLLPIVSRMLQVR